MVAAWLPTQRNDRKANKWGTLGQHLFITFSGVFGLLRWMIWLLCVHCACFLNLKLTQAAQYLYTPNETDIK